MDRIRILSHSQQSILFVDLAGCSSAVVAETIRKIPDRVVAHPHHSVLILTDLTGASVDADAVRAMQEAAVFDKPFVKRSAWLGANSLFESFRDKISDFSRRDFPAFTSRAAALDWLTTEDPT
jgi:mannose/fructose-specific phosphotransferase system component IIA